MSTPAVFPHTRPSGRVPKFFTTFEFGLGSGLLAGSTTSPCVSAVVPDTSAAAASTMTRDADMAAPPFSGAQFTPGVTLTERTEATDSQRRTGATEKQTENR